MTHDSPTLSFSPNLETARFERIVAQWATILPEIIEAWLAHYERHDEDFTRLKAWTWRNRPDYAWRFFPPGRKAITFLN